MTRRRLFTAVPLVLALACAEAPAPTAVAPELDGAPVPQSVAHSAQQTAEPCPSEVRFEEGANIRGSCTVSSPPQRPVPERRKAGTFGAAPPGIQWTYDPDTEILSWRGTTVDDNHIPLLPTRRTVVHNVEFIEEDDDRLFLHVQPSTVNRPTGRTFAEIDYGSFHYLRIWDASGNILPRGGRFTINDGNAYSIATAGGDATLTVPTSSDIAGLIAWLDTQNDLSGTFNDDHTRDVAIGNTRIRREMVPEHAFRIGPDPSKTVEGNWTIEIGSRASPGWTAFIPGSRINRERRHRYSSRYITFTGTGCEQADYGEVGGYHDRIKVSVWNTSRRGIRPARCP